MEGVDVVELFAREFPARPREYYERAHASGALRVENVRAKSNGGNGGNGGNDNARTSDVIRPLRPLKAGERVRHALHRHEPPTLDRPVEVIAVADDLVAIHKVRSVHWSPYDFVGVVNADP
jgi:hypothetical protein